MLSRSIYAQRFNTFADFTFGDQDAFGQPGQWRPYFGERIGPAFDGRVILEVGCFDAAYLCKIARAYPHTAFIGLDWKCKALYDGARRISDLGLRNVVLMRVAAQKIRHIFAEREIDEIWVFHPDPCDRKAELKNRLISEPFLVDAHRVLRDSRSSLSLKTDHPGYYQWVLGLFGLPQPESFTASDRPASADTTAAPTPRVRVRDLMPKELIPAPSPAVRACFDVTMNSADFWHDPAALAHSAGRCFSGEITLFERRFVKKRQPIYYFELRRKCRPVSRLELP